MSWSLFKRKPKPEAVDPLKELSQKISALQEAINTHQAETEGRIKEGVDRQRQDFADFLKGQGETLASLPKIFESIILDSDRCLLTSIDKRFAEMLKCVNGSTEKLLADERAFKKNSAQVFIEMDRVLSLALANIERTLSAQQSANAVALSERLDAFNRDLCGVLDGAFSEALVGMTKIIEENSGRLTIELAERDAKLAGQITGMGSKLAERAPNPDPPNPYRNVDLPTSIREYLDSQAGAIMGAISLVHSKVMMGVNAGLKQVGEIIVAHTSSYSATDKKQIELLQQLQNEVHALRQNTTTDLVNRVNVLITVIQGFAEELMESGREFKENATKAFERIEKQLGAQPKKDDEEPAA